MAKNFYYKRNPSAALRGMQKLTLEERGAYNTIIDMIYDHGGPLRDDEADIARDMGVDVRVWRRLRVRLLDLGKIYLTPGGRIGNQRADLEMGSATSQQEIGGTSAELPPEVSRKSEKTVKENKAPISQLESELKIEKPNPPPGVDVARARPGARHGAIDLDVLAGKIFDALPDPVKAKSDPGKILWALRGEVQNPDATADPHLIVECMATYYAHPQTMRLEYQYAARPDRYIEDGRWRGWIGKSAEGRLVSLDQKPQESTVEWKGKTWAVPAGKTSHLVGGLNDPGVQRQWSWMEDWRENPDRWRKTEQGPAPGKPGCRIWPEVLKHFGVADA